MMPISNDIDTSVRMKTDSVIARLADSMIASLLLLLMMTMRMMKKMRMNTLHVTAA